VPNRAHPLSQKQSTSRGKAEARALSLWARAPRRLPYGTARQSRPEGSGGWTRTHAPPSFSIVRRMVRFARSPSCQKMLRPVEDDDAWRGITAKPTRVQPNVCSRPGSQGLNSSSL
jgi:hypothetical protein